MEILHTIVHAVQLSLVIIKVGPIVFLIHVLVKSFLEFLSVWENGTSHMWGLHQTVYLMVNIESSDETIITRYPNSNIFSAKPFHHFRLDSDVFS